MRAGRDGANLERRDEYSLIDIENRLLFLYFCRATMADLDTGEYMISNIQWKKREEDAALRPLRGFTTGKLYVNSRKSRVEARFTDQNLSNRFSDLEEDGVYITLQVTLLGDRDVYLLPGWAPTLERSGACYVLRIQGWSDDVKAVHATV